MSRYLGYTDQMHSYLGGGIIFAFLLGLFVGIMRSSVIIHSATPIVIAILFVSPLVFFSVFYFDKLRNHVRESRRVNPVLSTRENLLIASLFWGYTACGFFLWKAVSSLFLFYLVSSIGHLFVFTLALLFTVNRQARLGRMIHQNDIYGVKTCQMEKV